jgi:transglutaminase-like putative cysteine protease
MEIAGSIELSPTVRFTVEADRERYWRTGAYDRFDGSTWLRVGDASPYERGAVGDPPGDREVVVQTYTAETAVETMPAAAEPVEVIGEATENTQVTELDTLRPAETFIQGDKYRIRSLVLNATAAELRNASTEYPERVTDRFLELPASTSEAFRERTANVTEDAENPYETAVAVESYLERTKNYSLEVEKPGGNVANRFLLEMDAGYCTYFATTMTTMLRSEGVPARVAVGYTTGQQVDDGEYLLRGLDSHVWVEAYFPEFGWVRFDPTPAGPRETAESLRIQQARQGGDDEEGPVDVGGSGEVPTTTPNVTRPAPGNGTVGNPGQFTIPGAGGTPTVPPNLDGSPGAGSGGSGGLPALPSGRDAVVGTVLLFGLAAGAHRVGAGERVYRAARLRWQGSRATPRSDVERAYERLEMILAKRYRERRPGETHRDYIADLSKRDLDDRAVRVAEIHERARYAGSADQAAADEAVELVNAMVRERTPVLGAIRRRRGA